MSFSAIAAMMTSPSPTFLNRKAENNCFEQRRKAPTLHIRLTFLLLLVTITGACQGRSLLTSNLGAADLERYTEIVQEMEFPQTTGASVPAALSPEPLRMREVRNLDQLGEDEIYRISLNEALATALESNGIIRNKNDFLSAGSTLLAHPDYVPSALDLNIQQTGAGGIDAALSAFDTQLATGAQWGQNALVQNGGLASTAFPRSDLLVNDSGSIYARIDKPLEIGSTVSLVHNWNYSLNNLPQQSFNTRYAGFLRAELRHPLWAGRGREFTSISGPSRYGNNNLGQGTALAELEGDISAANLQQQVQTQIKQTEELYWELWLAIQNYHSHAAARDSAHRLWKKVEGREKAGLEGGTASDVAQAEENFLERQNLVNAALTEVLEAEGRFRRMIGFAANDGRLLWPADQPMRAEFVPNWEDSLAQGLSNRLELVQQRFRIHSLELQIRAAKNLAHPQLDLVSGAQLNGFGNELVDGSSGSPGAYESILDPDQAGWNVGFEFSMPLGLHAANARVRNLQYRLSKARAVLRAQETEISHELSHCFRELDRWYAALSTAAKLRSVAQRRLQAVEADYDSGRATLDLLVRTQISLMQAEINAAQSAAAYNRALIELQFRKGMILSKAGLPPQPEEVRFLEDSGD